MSFRDHDPLERLSYRAQKVSARSITTQPDVARLRVNGLDTYPPFLPASARNANGGGSGNSTANHSPTIIAGGSRASFGVTTNNNNNTTNNAATAAAAASAAMSHHVSNANASSNPHYYYNHNSSNTTTTPGHAAMLELSTPTSPHPTVTLISWLHSPTRRAAFSLVSHPSSPSGHGGGGGGGGHGHRSEDTQPRPHNGSATQAASLQPPAPPPVPPPSSSACSLPQPLTTQSLPHTSTTNSNNNTGQQQQQMMMMHGYGPAASVSSAAMTTSSMGWFAGRQTGNAIASASRGEPPGGASTLHAMSLHSAEGGNYTPTRTTATANTTTTAMTSMAFGRNASPDVGRRADYNASDDNVYCFATSRPTAGGLLLAPTSVTTIATHATSITQSEANEEQTALQQQQQQPPSSPFSLLRCGPQGTMTLADTYSAATARPSAGRTNSHSHNYTNNTNNTIMRPRGLGVAGSNSTTSAVGGSGSGHNYAYNVGAFRGGGGAIPAAPPLTAAMLFGPNSSDTTNTSGNVRGVPFAWQPVPSTSSQLQPLLPSSIPSPSPTTATITTMSSPSAAVQCMRADALRPALDTPSGCHGAELELEEVVSPRQVRLLAPITTPHYDPSKGATAQAMRGSLHVQVGNSTNDDGSRDAAAGDGTRLDTTMQQQEEEREGERGGKGGGEGCEIVTLLVPQSSLHESLVRLMAIDSAATLEDEAQLYADAPTPAHTRALIAQSSQDRHRRTSAAKANNNNNSVAVAVTTVVPTLVHAQAQTSKDMMAETHAGTTTTTTTAAASLSPICSPLPEFPVFNESVTSTSAFTPTSMHASRIFDGIFSASASEAGGACCHCGAANHAGEGNDHGGIHMPHLCAGLHTGAKFELPVMLSLTGRDQLRENDPSEYEALFGTSRTSTMYTTFTRPRHGRRGTALARAIYSMAAKANAAAAAAAATNNNNTRVKSGGGRRNSHGLHRYVHCVTHAASSGNNNNNNNNNHTAVRRESSRMLTRTSMAMNNATSFATAASSMTNLNSTLSMGNFYCYYNATPCEMGGETQGPSGHTPPLSSEPQSLLLLGPEQGNAQDGEGEGEDDEDEANEGDEGTGAATGGDDAAVRDGAAADAHVRPGSPRPHTRQQPQPQPRRGVSGGARRSSQPSHNNITVHQAESNNNNSNGAAGSHKACTRRSHAQARTSVGQRQQKAAAPQPFSCARVWTTFRPRSAEPASRRNTLTSTSHSHNNHNNNTSKANNHNNGNLSTSTLSSRLDAGLVLPEPPFARSGSAVNLATASHTTSHHTNTNGKGNSSSSKGHTYGRQAGCKSTEHGTTQHPSSGDGSPIELAGTSSFAMATRMMNSDSMSGHHATTTSTTTHGSTTEGTRSRSSYACTVRPRASMHSHHAEHHIVVLPTQTCLCRHRRSHHQHHCNNNNDDNSIGGDVCSHEAPLNTTTSTTNEGMVGQGKRIRHAMSGSGEHRQHPQHHTTTYNSTGSSVTGSEDDGNPLGHQLQQHGNGTLRMHDRSLPRTESNSRRCLSITSLDSLQSSHLETLEGTYADSMPQAAHTIAPAASLLQRTLDEKSVS